MIARIWRGVVRTEDADDYAEYIRGTGFTEYAETPGNRGAHILRRKESGRTEFITFSLWDSQESIQGFAGEDIEKAVCTASSRPDSLLALDLSQPARQELALDRIRCQ
jgi:heme-degrading monooxygenase HmoA